MSEAGESSVQKGFLGWVERTGNKLPDPVFIFFYLIIAGIAVLIIPDYKEMLNISATQTSIMMALLGISIGVGDYVAGRISAHGIRPELILWGSIGTIIGFTILGFLPLSGSLSGVLLDKNDEPVRNQEVVLVDPASD